MASVTQNSEFDDIINLGNINIYFSTSFFESFLFFFELFIFYFRLNLNFLSFFRSFYLSSFLKTNVCINTINFVIYQESKKSRSYIFVAVVVVVLVFF